ncbi:nuclear movement protein, putative [Plasmodium malariae]|uniref:Nuclear migration protein nudC n=1 Tax=Plasmodium malariae TaxID=5858 RepID=A0A1C3L0M0_PLAMA|nr:nuclear movement protein, putative [Plasmodium malariae]
MDSDVVVNEKFDFIMLNIARECGDINNLMNLFFSFLLRKTDFITNSKSIEQCEEVVLKTLRKHYKKKEEYLKKLKKEYEKMDEEKKKIYEREFNRNNKKDSITDKKKNTNLKVNKNMENGKISNDRVVDLSEEEDEMEKTKNFEGMNNNDKELNKISDKFERKKNNNNNSGSKSRSGISNCNNNNGDNKNQNSKSDDSDEEDSAPPKGNGGKTEKYTWTQTINSLDMYIDLEEKVRTKDIKLDITYKKLYVKVKNEVLIDGEFYKHIKPEDSIWTLEDNGVIHLCIEKLNGMEWWSTVIKGDAEIDVKKIVPENSRMEDLDAETRSVVEKMLYDQKQKALNLPTSDEQKKFEIFEKFKKMHPEMDFSKANINYGNSSSNNMFFGN